MRGRHKKYIKRFIGNLLGKNQVIYEMILFQLNL
jgi:hypothetical protein